MYNLNIYFFPCRFPVSRTWSGFLIFWRCLWAFRAAPTPRASCTRVPRCTGGKCTSSRAASGRIRSPFSRTSGTRGRRGRSQDRAPNRSTDGSAAEEAGEEEGDVHPDHAPMHPVDPFCPRLLCLRLRPGGRPDVGEVAYPTTIIIPIKSPNMCRGVSHTPSRRRTGNHSTEHPHHRFSTFAHMEGVCDTPLHLFA